MPGKKRPRPWSSIDREYLAQDTVRELGERFGATGPLVFLAVVLEAGKVGTGMVEMRFGALARLGFTDAETARNVVCAAVEVGLLSSLEDDGRRFSARLTRWEAWEAKDPTSAQRSADYRARQESAAALPDPFTGEASA
jgi:hypothetical protein